MKEISPPMSRRREDQHMAVTRGAALLAGAACWGDENLGGR